MIRLVTANNGIAALASEQTKCARNVRNARLIAMKNVLDRCLQCGVMVYSYDRWRRLRAITCNFIALLPMYLRYHVDGLIRLDL